MTGVCCPTQGVEGLQVTGEGVPGCGVVGEASLQSFQIAAEPVHQDILGRRMAVENVSYYTPAWATLTARSNTNPRLMRAISGGRAPAGAVETL